jgi:multiple sugar transport system permease protein
MLQQSETFLAKDIKRGKRKPERRERRWLRGLTPYLLLLPAILFLFLFFFAPALFNFLLSFQRVSFFDVAKGGVWIGLSNFASILQDPQTLLSLRNTVFYLTIGTVVLRLILGVLLALLVNSSALKRWRLTGIMRTCFILPWAIPPVVAIAAWKWLLDPQFGVINQLLLRVGLIKEGIPFLVQTSTVWYGVIAIVVWRELPFVIISVLAGLQAIPGEIIEAARVDGATRLHIFRFVTLPLLAPVLLTVGWLTTIWTYNNFVFVWLTTRGGPGNFTQVLGTQLYNTAFIDYDFGKGAAVGVLMTLVMVIFSTLYYTFIFKGRVGQA